ncbi:hypothetical protein CC2G_001741 [Coprinopsis cinerea AmutBmut pab1-1]|nr:hypothetical protein CC2G_001741 [Coprinopsis cinerea AmutBmut pab1-1]
MDTDSPASSMDATMGQPALTVEDQPAADFSPSSSNKTKSIDIDIDLSPAKVNPQDQSILYHTLPLELRRQIFIAYFTSYSHPSKPYRFLSYYYRPGHTAPKCTDVALLRVCRRVYAEARELVWHKDTGNGEESFWIGSAERRPRSHRLEFGGGERYHWDSDVQVDPEEEASQFLDDVAGWEINDEDIHVGEMWDQLAQSHTSIAGDPAVGQVAEELLAGGPDAPMFLGHLDAEASDEVVVADEPDASVSGASDQMGDGGSPSVDFVEEDGDGWATEEEAQFTDSDADDSDSGSALYADGFIDVDHDDAIFDDISDNLNIIGHYDIIMDLHSIDHPRQSRRTSLFTPSQWSKITKIQIFPQMYACKSYEFAAFFTSVPELQPKTVVITIRYTDWWWWERDNALDLTIAPPSTEMYFPPSVETLVLELETIEKKKGELEAHVRDVIRGKEGWKWKRFDGECLELDVGDLSEDEALKRMAQWEWMGPTKFNGANGPGYEHHPEGNEMKYIVRALIFKALPSKEGLEKIPEVATEGKV